MKWWQLLVVGSRDCESLPSKWQIHHLQDMLEWCPVSRADTLQVCPLPSKFTAWCLESRDVPSCTGRHHVSLPCKKQICHLEGRLIWHLLMVRCHVGQTHAVPACMGRHHEELTSKCKFTTCRWAFCDDSFQNYYFQNLQFLKVSFKLVLQASTAKGLYPQHFDVTIQQGHQYPFQKCFPSPHKGERGLDNPDFSQTST